MDSHGTNTTRLSRACTAAGIDHVRLSYQYLDAGDIDAYGSLLDQGVQIRYPGAPVRRGRAEVLRVSAATGPPGRHDIHRIIADGDGIAVLGRFTPPPAPHAGGPCRSTDFVDIFTLTEVGLLRSCDRFYREAPCLCVVEMPAASGSPVAR
jgi:hypothetical protein